MRSLASQMRPFLDRLLRRNRPFVVPERFNRNSPTVTALMTPEQSGSWLLARLRERLGVASLADLHLLDFGCGVRFAQAIINCRIPIGSYTGVDCDPAMIEFLRGATPSRRFRYHLFDVRNPMYNPGGVPLSPDTVLPVCRDDYDVVTMFSVITHQTPEDSAAIFSILRRHTAPRGRLFFTCFLDPGIVDYEDCSPERNVGRCVYAPGFLRALVEQAGWTVLDVAPAEPPLIGDSFLLAPAQAAPSSRGGAGRGSDVPPGERPS
jgi:SAM-dependent methyltransferase